MPKLNLKTMRYTGTQDLEVEWLSLLLDESLTDYFHCCLIKFVGEADWLFYTDVFVWRLPDKLEASMHI